MGIQTTSRHCRLCTLNRNTYQMTTFSRAMSMWIGHIPPELCTQCHTPVMLQLHNSSLLRILIEILEFAHGDWTTELQMYTFFASSSFFHDRNFLCLTAITVIILLTHLSNLDISVKWATNVLIFWAKDIMWSYFIWKNRADFCSKTPLWNLSDHAHINDQISFQLKME